MHFFTCLSMLATHLIALGSCLSSANGPEQLPISPTPYLRNATVSDAEAITTTILAAFHDSPHWKYAHQFMDKYPKEHHDCMYEAMRAALHLPDVLAQVVLLPNITEPHEPTPIAVALWVLPSAWWPERGDERVSSSLLSTLMVAKCEHRDLNITRAIDAEHHFRVAKQRYLDNVYARSEQLYLDTLATHPDYQRHGAGGALVDSGVTMGKDAYEGGNVTATLIATVLGEPLYMHLGWKSIRNFTVHSLDVVNGTREGWRFDVMTHSL